MFSHKLLTKCTNIKVIFTVSGRVAPVVRCHVSSTAFYTCVKLKLNFPHELTKEARSTDDGLTPTAVTSYPKLQNPNTCHPKVWGKKNWILYWYTIWYIELPGILYKSRMLLLG